MSGTRIPDGSPHKSGAGKPEFEGRKPAKPVGGNVLVELKNSSTAPNPLLSQRTAFGVQQSQISQLGTAQPGSFPQLPLSEKPVEVSLDKVTHMREVFRQTAVNLGLPQDALSFSLLVFSRYFSLSLGPALIGQLRREVLATGKASSPGTSGEKAALEAQAMAAVIAADKGVALSPEALARYAGFLLPPVLPVSGNKEHEPEENEKMPDPEEVQALAQEQESELLGFFNSIPGKNGQYWMVFPFNMTAKGTEYNVILRVLKKDFLMNEFLPATGSEEIIVDISGPKRQWRCFLARNSGNFRTDIRVYPECSPKGLELLQKEAERYLREGNIQAFAPAGVLGSVGNFEVVQVRNGDKEPSWTEDLFAFCLPSISKDV